MKYQQVSLEIPPLFSFPMILKALDRGYDEILYKTSDHSVIRLIQFSDGMGIINVYQSDEKSLTIEIQKDDISKSNVKEASDYVKEWFDMDRDIRPFYILLKKEEKLRSFPEKFEGLRLIGIPDLFEAICWAIIGQQINLTFAHSLKKDLVKKYGDKYTLEGEIFYAFPRPDILATAKKEDLKKLRFSRQKTDYLLNISEAFVSGKINKHKLLQLPNAEDRIEALKSIKGVGVWTANYALMMSTRDMGSIAYGDSGLNKALHVLYQTEKRPAPEVVDEIFKNFKGWESYLNYYLWKSLAFITK